MARYRMIITSIWWGFGLAIILLFVWLSMNPTNFGKYNDDALDWLLPHLIPTMTLTGAVAYAKSPSDGRRVSKASRFAFTLACVVSLIYLLLVLAIILRAVTGTGEETERGAVDVLSNWNKILGVLQGLAASAIGVFFVRDEEPEPDKTAP
jgi:hypothetical protein